MLQGPAAFVIAILGCGEGEAQCQQVALAPARYESRADCLAASDQQLIAHANIAYPVVVAECRAAGEQATTITANEVRLPEPRRGLPIRTAGRR